MNITDEFINLEYLGDGVYIGKNNKFKQISIFTYNGIDITDIIILDDVEITALIAYLKREFL